MEESDAKRALGRHAAAYVRPGMVVGIGSGSTVRWLIEALGNRVAEEGLEFLGVAASEASLKLARQRGLKMATLSRVERLDLAIDGADEVDPHANLIKGGGGALVRERLVALAASKFLVIVDGSKLVPVLGSFPLPIEILRFGFKQTLKRIRALGVEPKLRMNETRPFVSNNGNYIVDAGFGQIANPAGLYQKVRMIPGVVDCGIFSGFHPTVLVAERGGVSERSDLY
jgi:ribose 5-phosphate isomerase A